MTVKKRKRKTEQKTEANQLVPINELPTVPEAGFHDIDLSYEGATDDRPWFRITDPKSRLIKRAKGIGTKESTYKYYLFCTYLMIPAPIRTLKYAQELAQEKLKREVPMSTMQHASSQFSWADRAYAYDDYIAQRQLENNEKAILQMNDHYAAVARKLINAYMIPHQAIMEKIRNDPDYLVDLSEKPTLKLLETLNKFTMSITELMKMERLSRGVSTENVARQSKVDITIQQSKDFMEKLNAVDKRIKEEN